MLSPEAYEAIQIEKRDNGVVVATLNRPEKRNAVDDTMHHELGQLPCDADSDRDVKVLVITGAGRAFCAGGDFSGGLRPGNTRQGSFDLIFACNRQQIKKINSNGFYFNQRSGTRRLRYIPLFQF